MPMLTVNPPQYFVDHSFDEWKALFLRNITDGFDDTFRVINDEGWPEERTHLDDHVLFMDGINVPKKDPFESKQMLHRQRAALTKRILQISPIDNYSNLQHVTHSEYIRLRGEMYERAGTIVYPRRCSKIFDPRNLWTE